MHLLQKLCLAASAVVMPLVATASPCTSLSDVQEQKLIQYLRAKYKIPDSISLTIKSDSLVSDTCFHQLTFQGVSPLKKWELNLYLSPDGRYLTSDLFDTTVNPIEEERKRLQKLMTSLSDNTGSSLGVERAPVTIVEFSDFQCPYCRKLSQAMQQVLPSEANNVRVVFHHMPLSIHQWARLAAEGAACAQLQSSKAFWTIHDQLFSQQPQITSDNIRTKLNEFARAIPGLDLAAFQSCLDNEMSLGLVVRDINLATSNEITGTPTLFINGHRVQGVKDAEQLRRLVEDVLKAARSSAGEDATASGANREAIVKKPESATLTN